MSINIILILPFIFIGLDDVFDLIKFIYFRHTNKSEQIRNPLIHTKLGTVEGLWASDGDYSMFMGIPYAMVNETNPFGSSIPYQKFKEIFKAHNDSAMCPQIEDINQTLVGSLDCLHLNIYVPNVANSNNTLPVLVYIYGGRYEVGFAGRYFYGPKYLMKQNVILVVVNYRLGPYGFLCLDIPEIPGNQGLRNQIAALKWINENIQSFGGDSNKITLSGISSGGENIYLHLLYGKDILFNQLIIVSGLISQPITMGQANISVPLVIAADLGLKTSNIHEALKFLTTKDTNSVINSSNKLNIAYKPCVEKQFKNVDRYITNYTMNMLSVPNIENVSILLEQTSNERFYVYPNTDFKESKYKNIFRDEIYSQFDFDNDKLQKSVDYIRRFYVGDENFDEHVKQNIINFSSDLLHNYPMKRAIDMFLVNGAKKVYYGVFSYVGERNYMRELRHVHKSCNGAIHADDIGYLFDVSYMKDRTSDDDMLIVERKTTLWANFVKYGDPTPDVTKLLPMKWKPVTKNKYMHYNIDKEITTVHRPFQGRMAFWDLFYELNGKFERLMVRTN